MGFLFGAGTNPGYQHGYHGHYHAPYPQQAYTPHYHHKYSPYPSHAHKHQSYYPTNDAYMCASNPYLYGANSSPMYHAIQDHSYPEAIPYYEASNLQAHAYPLNPYEHGSFTDTHPHYFSTGTQMQSYGYPTQPFVYQAEQDRNTSAAAETLEKNEN